MDSDVLLIPVNVHVFRAADGSVSGLPEYVVSDAWLRNTIDPGLARDVNQVIVNEGGVLTSSSEMVHWQNKALRALPDTIWNQCNIQFRIRQIENIYDSGGLEEQLWTAEECLNDPGCGTGGNPDVRLGEYIANRDADPGIHVYVGGSIHSNCTGTFGFTTAVTCGSDGGTRCLAPRAHRFMAMDAARIYDEIAAGTGPDTWAHEFGHFFGIGHLGETCDPPGTTFPNIMNSSGINSDTVANGILTPAQCERARCRAEQWLDRWGLVPDSPTSCP